MTAEIELYDRFEHKLAVLGAPDFALGERSWCLSKIGDCDFRVPVGNPKCTAANLGGGNLVIVKSDSGLPDWGGRIDSATWDGQGEVEVKCRSREVLLWQQIVDWDAIPDSNTHRPPGLIMQEILRRKLEAGDIVGLRIGEIYTGGNVVGLSALGEDIWDSIIPQLRDKSYELSGYSDRKHEVYVQADGTFNWLSQRGSDKRGSVLIRGGWHTVKNSVQAIYDWSKIVTRGWGWGNHSSWEDKVKRSYNHIGWQSVYGVREADTDARTNDDDDVFNAAKHLIAGPSLKFDLTINARLPWDRVFVGDIVKVQLPHHGWYADSAEPPCCAGINTALRIEAIRVDEQARRMRLIGKEWSFG